MNRTPPTSCASALARPSGEPMRVLVVHQNECAFTCVWHLTTLFEGVRSDGEILWHSCSPEDCNEAAALARAAECACAADVIVFCHSRSTGLSPEVKRWMERWIPAKAGQEAALGLLVPCGHDGSSDTEAHLRDVARRGGMTFLGVGHCAYEQIRGNSECAVGA
jgi:hypothetical protein